MSTEKSMIQLAEIRLAQLVEEGVVTGTGIALVGGEQRLFVGIDPGIDKNAPEYKSKISVILDRLKEVLQDVPFEVLGQYDDDLPKEDTHEVLSPSPTPRTAAAEAPSHVVSPTESLMAEIVRLREANEGLHESNRRWEEIFKEQLGRVAEAQREIEQLREALIEARRDLEGKSRQSE